MSISLKFFIPSILICREQNSRENPIITPNTMKLWKKAQNLREREIADKQYNELKETHEKQFRAHEKEMTLEWQRSDSHCEVAVEKAKFSTMQNLMKYNFPSEYKLIRAAYNEKVCLRWWK